MWQKKKKNQSRVLAKDRGLYPSTQKKRYVKIEQKKEELPQASLFTD